MNHHRPLGLGPYVGRSRLDACERGELGDEEEGVNVACALGDRQTPSE
jgi:hypothetical protein